MEFDRTELERDGWTLVVRRLYDDAPDLSWLGEWSDTPHDDPRLSVDHWASEYGYVHERDRWSACAPPVYRYFNPELGGSAGFGLDRLISEYARHYDGSRDRAYRQIMLERMEDYRRVVAYERGDWHMVAVVVEARRKGVELGSASCGGIESDSDEAYFDEVAGDLADGAISVASKRLAALCAS